MVAHGASSLLVKLLDMKMWDGSLIKYYISFLVCPAVRIFSEILISHSLRIFWIHRILLHGGKPWPKRNSNLPPDEASSNPHCFCYCRRAVDNTIITYIVCCGNFVSTLSGKYSRNVASSQRNYLVCAVRLCRFVAIDRSRSVAVIGFVSNQNDDKLGRLLRWV
jgi:hypothetical protein